MSPLGSINHEEAPLQFVCSNEEHYIKRNPLVWASASHTPSQCPFEHDFSRGVRSLHTDETNHRSCRSAEAKSSSRPGRDLRGFHSSEVPDLCRFHRMLVAIWFGNEAGRMRGVCLGTQNRFLFFCGSNYHKTMVSSSTNDGTVHLHVCFREEVHDLSGLAAAGRIGQAWETVLSMMIIFSVHSKELDETVHQLLSTLRVLSWLFLSKRCCY